MSADPFALACDFVAAQQHLQSVLHELTLPLFVYLQSYYELLNVTNRQIAKIIRNQRK